MSSQPLKIFLSSTTRYMRVYRESVANALMKIDQFPVDMRNFGAYNSNPQEVSKEKVAQANVFIGLMGYYYGAGVSELEYTAAMQAGLIVLMYAPDPSVIVKFNPDPGHLEDQDPLLIKLDPQQQLFFDRVQREGHTIGTYRDPTDLPVIVVADMFRVITGGVSGVIAYRKGLRELQTGNYSSANLDLAWAVHLLPNDSEPPFLQALALLNGREPRNVSRTEIVRIEELLHVSASLKPSRGVFALWYAIKRDFWIRNGFDQPHEQDALRLRAQALSIARDPMHMALIKWLQPQLYDRFIHQFS